MPNSYYKGKKFRRISSRKVSICLKAAKLPAYRILCEATEACGIREVGTHTLRKTVGYHLYLDTKDVVTLYQNQPRRIG